MNISLAQRQQSLIEQMAGEQQALDDLQSALHKVDSEIAELEPQRQQFHLLGVVCESLDQLNEMGNASLFWGEGVSAAEHEQKIARSRALAEQFNRQLAAVDSRRQQLLVDLEERQGNLNELAWHYDEVTEELANIRYDYVIEREPDHDKLFRDGLLPWAAAEEDRRRLRKALLVGLLFMLVIGGVPRFWEVPARDPDQVVEIPERLARMVRERQAPKPVERPVERPREEQQEATPQPQEQVAQQRPEPTREEVRQARESAQNRGVLAHSSMFAELQDEAMAANLGANARISGDFASGGAESRGAEGQRAMITASAGGSGAAAALGAVSRGGVGTGSGAQIAGSGVSTGSVQSEVASIQEQERPVSAGAGPSRTDQEIQIVFDRHKSALYRLYNRELRNNPTLRGKMVLELTIEPDGSVSACRVRSTDLDSPSLAREIVERVKRFNFGAKEGVPSTTIVYPIDFLPAG